MRTSHQNLYQLSIYRPYTAPTVPQLPYDLYDLATAVTSARECWREDLYRNREIVEAGNRERQHRLRFAHALALRCSREYVGLLIDRARGQVHEILTKVDKDKLEASKRLVADTDNDLLEAALTQIAVTKPGLFGFLQRLAHPDFHDDEVRDELLCAPLGLLPDRAANILTSVASAVNHQRVSRSSSSGGFPAPGRTWAAPSAGGLIPPPEQPRAFRNPKASAS